MPHLAVQASQSRSETHFWEGFANRFQNLWKVTTDHYILMPTLTLAIIAAATFWNPVGWTLTFAALGMIGYKAHQASTNYFLGNQTEGLTQFGETLADTTLLGGGLALGRAGQAMIPVKNGSNAGAAFHLVDEIAAGILFVKNALASE